MSGKAGRSGRRPKSVEAHLQAGTYRPHRHGPRPATVAAPTAWQPAAEELEGLGDEGQRFLTRMLAEYDYSGVEGVLLIQAAHTLDGLLAWRAAATTDKQSARLTLAHTKVLAQLLAQLRVQA
jgi:hypothetical protein